MGKRGPKVKPPGVYNRHCYRCKVKLHDGNCYLKDGKPAPSLCKPCNVLLAYRQRWRHKDWEQVLAEINRLQERLSILNSLL